MFDRNFIILLVFYNFYSTQGEERLETYCNINGKYPLHHISEKFLSLSIDPEVLSTGLNLSDTSLLLSKHLSPAYIRIVGRPTQLVKHVENEDKSVNNLSSDGNNVVLTPSMWFGINEWLKLANLTPVFGINEDETTGGAWNPKSTLPLLEISDKLNVSCYWMLGFVLLGFCEHAWENGHLIQWGPEKILEKEDNATKRKLKETAIILLNGDKCVSNCSINIDHCWLQLYQEEVDSLKKKEAGYKEDLDILQDILATFPERNNSGNINGDLPTGNTQCAFEDFKDIVTTVTWELNSKGESLLKKESGLKVTKTPVKYWTVSPKPEPVSFFSTLLWADQVGNAAKMGYDVVFRQPELENIFSDTPAYWFSLLHKKLIGKSVLEAKPLAHHPGCSVFAHCTKEQNDFKGNGALTVMVVNSNPQGYKVKIKLENIPWSRFIEIHSYILTSSTRNSTDIFLNGKKITPRILLEKDHFQPKISIMKFKTYVSLKVPPMAIGFFVLPRAKVPVCINEEKGRNFVPEGRKTVKSLPISEDSLFNNDLSPEGLQRRIRKVFELDENVPKPSLRLKLNHLKQRIQSDSVESSSEFLQQKDNLKKDILQDRYKEHLELIKRREELKKNIFGQRKKQKIFIGPRSRHLDLESEETERILRDRARSRAAQKKIFLTEDELDIIVEAVRRKFLKPKLFSSPVEINTRMDDIAMVQPSTKQDRRSLRKPRDVNTKLLNLRAKIEENRQRLEERMSDVVGNAQTLKQNIRDRIKKIKQKNYRFKRDINMELLKLKTEERFKKAKKLMKKHSKSLFKDKKLKKDVTSQSSSDELSDLDDEEDSSVDKVTHNMNFFTESATSEESGQEKMDSEGKDRQPKKLSILERIKQVSAIKPNKDSSRLKPENDDSEEVENSLAFLTASDEINDIGAELPCISEYFRSSHKKSKKKQKGKMVDNSKGKTFDSMEYLRKKRSLRSYENVQELGEVENDVSKAATSFDESDDELDLNEKSFDKRSVVDCLENYRNQFKNGQYETFKRVKRNTEDISQDDMKADTPIYKIKQRLKDLLQAKEVDKLKFETDALKNKLKLHILENKKDETQKVGDKKEEIHEKLKSLREKLTVKLKDINKIMTNSTRSQTVTEDQQNIKKDTVTLRKFENKEDTDCVNEENDNPAQVNIIDSTTKNKRGFLNINVVKRSLSDNNGYDFGNYKPLTPGLREWKPSDILSLKRECNFDSSNTFEPINDLLMFRNVIIPNEYSDSRRKRKIVENSLDYFDKDTYMNEIEKETYIIPKIKVDGEDYKLRITAQDSHQKRIDEDISVKSSTSDPESEIKEETPTSVESMEVRVTFNDNSNGINDETSLADNITTVINRISDNIQKIPTKEEQNVVDGFINKISGFFSNIGLALRHYL